ncbi:unnamed protein product [Paramecium sonneborni]|uniref:PH domain-containing protein n=1 Tax=Paramecium sonneborni TaxID=65129 RepID=A0A8S1MIT1_9CILI|nr:unnamed protein product [Paramecium sonneborni]
MEGYLKKWTNLFSRWQDRYFILNEDILLYCDSQGGPIKGQVHLKVAALILVPEDPLRIIINTGTTEIHLRANNINEKIDWINALKSAQDRCLSRQNEIKFEQKIQELLTDVWQTGAIFDETLSMLIPKLEKNSQIKEMADRLESIGKNLKTKITLCAQIVEEEKQKLSNQENGTVYESFIHQNSAQSVIRDDLLNHQHFSTHIQSQLMSVSEIGLQIRDHQPTKYNNIINNPAFQKIKFGNSPKRDRLPYKKDPNEKINVWYLCKELIGKDLGRFSVPIILNEPLSMLQRLAEQMEYSESLEEADKIIGDSALRMCYIMGFGVSPYSANIGRTKKPFNPILGETYEIQTSNCRFISEQVSHHPPISAGYAESKTFQFWAHTDVQTKFNGLCFQVNPVGLFNVILKTSNDHYQFNRCTTKVQNILWGQQYLDHMGQMKFVNLTTGDNGVLELIEKSGKSECEMRGYVKDKNGNEKYKLKGFWNDRLIAYDSQREIVVWKRHQLPQDSDWYYNFTEFAMQLNHLTIEMIKELPCTDCRLRPDQLAFENGWVDLASSEKHRLEEKQRARRKAMAAANQVHVPMFFEEIIEPKTNLKWYKYKGNYFQQQWKQVGQELLDLF